MTHTNYVRFIHFLPKDLEIPERAIEFAERIHQRISPQGKNQKSSLLPMILGQYGLMIIEQLNRTFVRLENV